MTERPRRAVHGPHVCQSNCVSVKLSCPLWMEGEKTSQAIALAPAA